jgi:hypothetical protein
MGINNLAVQTFSSSGSQSVTRANKADNSKQITSDFISRPPIKYINGSGLSVIQGTFVRLPQSTSGATYPSETFNIPNNIDAISDMVLSMNLNMSTTSTYDSSGIYYSKTFLLDIINKIEIRMAGLIIQTIYPGDIYMRNYSELGTLISQENSFNIKRDSSYVDTGSIIGHTTASAETISFSLSIPFIGRSSDKDRSFLQTGSFTKNLAVTVFYNKIFDSSGNTLSVIPLLACSPDASANLAVETKLTILSHIITDTEKNYIKQNIINRVINTSAGVVTRKIQERFIAASSARDTTAIDIDLDSIDLNVTHLLFCLNVDIFNQDPSNNEVIQTPRQYIRFGSTDKIRPEQLKGVPRYVTGDNRLSSSWGKAYLDSNISDGSNSIMNPDVLGVFNGWLSSAELVLGNETTGQIPCSALYSSKVEFNLQNIDENFYVLKLADNAFSSAGVPFSRIKNKKLILNVRNRFFSTTAAGSFTPPTRTGTFPYTPLGTIGAYIQDARRDATISVCACGTTLQIINNNTISFSYI